MRLKKTPKTIQKKFQKGHPLTCKIMSLDIIHKTVMVAIYPLYPCLLSVGSVLSTLEAAENVQAAGLFWSTWKMSLSLHIYKLDY